MRVEVRTCSRVRIMLEMERVASQRRIINGKKEYFQITQVDGKIMDLEHAVPGVPLGPDINITRKSRYLSKLNDDIIDGKVEDGKIVQSAQDNQE